MLPRLLELLDPWRTARASPSLFLMQSIGQAGSSPGTVQTASVGDNTGVTNLSTGPATYDATVQRLTIPGINFNLSCPTGLRVSWTSGQPTAQTQQPATATGGLLAMCMSLDGAQLCTPIEECC